MSERPEEGFGGGDESGLLCGCGRRVRTPFCPWCGKRLDDDGVQLLAYLEARVAEHEKNASTREANGRGYPEDRVERTVARLRQAAQQRREWADWVRARLNK